METKLVAILGGGDWNDASVDHLVLPAQADLHDAKRAYNTWYRNVYCPAVQRRRLDSPPDVTYMSFVDFLRVNYGATIATDTDILIVEDI